MANHRTAQLHAHACTYKLQGAGKHIFRTCIEAETYITRDMCSGARVSRGNTHHCNTGSLSRLRASSLLVVGLRGLSADVCKNVVLAGVQNVTVLDDQPLGREGQGYRFLATVEGQRVMCA